jgi:DNA-binding transcriptional LysR family regulator
VEDLNDLFIFSQLVEHHGFAGAARALGISRSCVCRRVKALEERVGVRLVQRSTRHFAVTDLGRDLFDHCLKIVTEARAAYEHIARARAKPAGLIRLSCTPVVAQLLVSPLLPEFSEKNPEVRIAIEASNGRIDLDENFDLYIRIRQVPSENSEMVMRSLGIIQHVLVANRAFLERHGRPTSPAAAARLPTISHGPIQGPHLWKLVAAGEEVQIRHEPKFITDDMVLARQAAAQGLGIAQLPLSLCLNELRQGLLEIILPDFPAPLFEVQVLFASRRGMLPAVRSFIDFLSAHCVGEAPSWQGKRHNGNGYHAQFSASRSTLEHLTVEASSSTDNTRRVRVA